MGKEDKVIHASDQTFDAEILKSDKPALVDFWAPWCGPCKAIGPMVEELAETYGDRLKVAKVNVDECPETTGRYGIQSIPTLMLFKGGKMEEKLIGLVPKNRLEEFLKKVL
ncbi:MAG TPA: thioredoxin [Syntrophales bacterium]|nr:thioredoxin [Syntrophales bacterium]